MHSSRLCASSPLCHRLPICKGWNEWFLVGYPAQDHAVLAVLAQNNEFPALLEEIGLQDDTVVMFHCHKEGNASDYKDAGINIWLGKWLFLWVKMKEKNKI